MTARTSLVEEYFAGFRASDHARILATLTDDITGTSVAHGPFRFAFSDLFTFRGGLIARVDSYVVPLP